MGDNLKVNVLMLKGDKGDTGSVKNLKIGGVNLLSDTKEMKKDSGWIIGGLSEDNEKYKGFTVLKNSTTGWCEVYHNVNLEIGKTYTCSAYIKVTDALNTVYFQKDKEEYRIYTKKDEWTRISYTFTATIENDKPRFTCRNNSIGSYYICGYKLEREETPTGWTPSLEDYETKFNNIIARLEALEAK